MSQASFAIDQTCSNNLEMTWQANSPLHISQQNQRNCSPTQESGADLLLLPRDKEEAYGVMKIIHNQKVHYLKQAIFELQKQNAVLAEELNRRNKEQMDTPCILHKSVEEKLDVKPEQSALEQYKQLVENLLVTKKDTINQDFPTIHNVEKVDTLEEKIKQLEKEVGQQKLLVEHQEIQVKSLLNSRMLLREKFQKKLKSEKTKVLTEMHALLLEAKAKHLLTEANQETERAKQLDVYVSSIHETFQNHLLSTHARNSQSRHDDLQRISELEMKLTSSLAAL